MATATVESTPAAADGGAGILPVDSVPVIDLRALSQSELFSLSQCSSADVGPLHCDDEVIPKIDRSVFNESAGSRKQTYSRLRLAPASSTTAPAPRRRTPHLRPAAVTHNNIGHSDPEKEETSQIIALLKQLFVSNSNPDDLIPVKVDYTYPLLPEQLSSFPSSSSSNVVTLSQKRKRGRPSRREMLVNNSNSAQRVNANLNSFVDNPNNKASKMVRKIVAGENMGDRDKDRDLLNRDGLAVDLVSLGTVEHPYGDEIQRRTEGLKTREELLRFLEALNGKWGTTRKKRRIVDACMFGSALPTGWKLLLALKKKQGHVWVYCRRYISPGGRQFVSCKDVSSYLRSLHCVQDTNMIHCAENNETINNATSLASTSIADVTKQDDSKMVNTACHASSLASTISGNHGLRVPSDAECLPEDKVGKNLRKGICKMTSSEKDDLQHHQSSVLLNHIYMDGVSNDAAIVKVQNCGQITHNTLEEMKFFKDHIGATERNHMKSAAESISGDGVDANSNCGHDGRVVISKESLGSVANNIVETSNMNTSDHVGDCVQVNDNLRVDEILSNNEKSSHKASVDEQIPGSIAGISVDCCNKQGKSSEGHSPVRFTDHTAGVRENIIENSITLEDYKRDSGYASGLLGSNHNLEKCDVAVSDGHHSSSTSELKHDAVKCMENESVVGFFSTPVVQENCSAIGVKKLSNLEVLPSENADSMPISSICTETCSDQNKEPKRNPLIAYLDEEGVIEDRLQSSIGEDAVDGKCSFRISESSSEADKDVLNCVQEMQFAISSVVPSWNEQASVKDSGSEEPTFLGKEVGMQNTCKDSFLVLSDHERSVGTEHFGEKVCGREMQEPEGCVVKNVRTTDLFLPFNGHNSDSVIGIKEEEILQRCSPAFGIKKNMMEDVIGVISSASNCKQELSLSELPSQSCTAEVSSEAYSVNKISSTYMNDPKFLDIEKSRTHKLSLSSSCSNANADTIEQEKNLLGSFSVQYGTEKTCGVQTNFFNNGSSAIEDAERGKPSGFGMLDSSLNSKSCNLGTSLSMNYPGRHWDGSRGNEVGNYENNFMIGFDRNNMHSDEDVMAHGIWTASQENALQGRFTSTGYPQVQSSSCFHSFDIMSDKDTQGLFGVNDKYEINTNIEGMRTGRAEPVEYSFLGSNSSNAIPIESNVFSHSSSMEQGLDSSFWLESIAEGGNKSSSVCVWCRNVFYHEPVQPEIETTGAIGSMCQACSSRMPGHFNLL